MADLFTAIVGDPGTGTILHTVHEGAQVRSTILNDDTALTHVCDHAMVCCDLLAA